MNELLMWPVEDRAQRRRRIRRRALQALVAAVLAPFMIVFATWANGEWVLGHVWVIGQVMWSQVEALTSITGFWGL